jgi:hypothetical protein
MFFATISLLCTAAPSFAQTYPDKPVRVVVGFPAGGPTDVIARIVAQKLSDSLGQQYYVENMGGAGGNIAAGQVAHATPDGYTIMAVALGTGDALHHSQFVEFDDRFGEIEVDRSSSLSLAVQDHGEITHACKIFHLRRVLLARRWLELEYRVDGGVGHAVRRANHAFADFVTSNFALRVDLHGAGQNQPIDVREQAANVG